MELPSEQARTLGQWLRKERVARHWSLANVSHNIQVSPAFLEALENDEYRLFPAKVYALGFLRKLLKLYAPDKPDALMDAFQTAWAAQMSEDQPAHFSEKNHYSWQFGPRHIALGAAGIFLLAFILFLGTRLSRFVSSPELTLEKPPEAFILAEPVVDVSGRTEKESRLTVNGRELKIDERGFFDEPIELLAGRNTLEFVAENRFGKTSKVVRNVLVK